MREAANNRSISTGAIELMNLSLVESGTKLASLVVAVLVSLLATSVEAATYSWTNTISGNWSAGGNWDTQPTAPSSATDTIIQFNQAGTYTTTNDISAGFLLNQLNFGGATVTLRGNSLAFTNDGGTLPQINQNGSTAVTITNTLSLATNLTFGGSGTGLVTITGFIGTGSTTGSLTHAGAGVLYLNNANNCAFSGGIIVSNNATLRATCGSATTALGLQSSTWVGPPIVLNNATLIFDGGGWNVTPVTFSGTNTIMPGPSGGPYWEGGARTGTGKIIIGGNTGMSFGNMGNTVNHTCEVVIAQGPGGYIQCGDGGTAGSFGFGQLTFASTNGARLGVSNSNGANLRNNPVILQTNLWYFGNYGNNQFYIYGNITGPGSLGKEFDTGDSNTGLYLVGTNTYSGGTIWLSGYLRPYNTDSLGTGPVIIGGKASSSHAAALANMAALTLTNNFILIGITNTALAWNPLAQTEFNTAFDLTLSVSVSGSGGLLKTGAGTLTIPGSSTFSGPVTVAGGILNLNGYPVNNAAVFLTGGIMQNATLQAGGYIFSGGTNNANLGGSGVLTVNGGPTIIFGANTYSGGAMINAGSVSFMTTNAWPSSGTVTVASGATLGLGVTGVGSFGQSDVDALFAGTMPNVSMNAAALVGIDTTMGNWTNTTSQGGTYGLNKLGANTLTLSGVNTYSGGTLISAGMLKLGALNALPAGGAVTVAGGIYDLGGFATVTNGVITMTSGYITNGTLQGASYTFSGGTSFAVLAGSGVVLTNLSGTTTLMTNNTFTGGAVINGGTLTLNFANTATDLINSGNVLTLGGGTLNLTGKGSATDLQTFASTTMTANRSSTITLNQNGATSLTLALGAFTRNTGSLLNFNNVPNTSTIIATTSTGNEASGILAPWATCGIGVNRQYVTVNGGNQIVTYAGATATTQPATLSDVTDANVNYSFAAGATLTGPITANTLRYTGAAATLANGGNNITLNGLLCAGSGALAISGAGNLVIGSTRDLVINFNQNWCNITCPIVDNGGGPSAVTIYMDGVGELSFSGNNTFSGGFTASGGGQIDYGPSSFGSGPMTVSGISLQGSGTQTNSITCLNGTRLRNGITFTGPIFLKDTTYTGWSYDGTSVNLYGTISGPGGLSQTAGTLTLKGTNTYSGGTTVANNGTLSLGNTNALGTGPLYFSNGSQLTTTVDTSGGSGITNSMVLLLDGTINAGYNMLLSGVISGSANLIKAGNSNLVLSGVNTFSGNTILSAGKLVLSNSLALQNSTLLCNNMTANTNVAFAAGITNFTLGGISGTNNLALINQAGSAINLSVGNNLGIGSRYDGMLSGGRGFTKICNSRFTLTATNTFTGSTTISAGVLELGTNGAIAASGSLTIGAGAQLTIGNTNNAIPDGANLVLNGRLNLANGVNETVNTLYFGSSMQPTGTWGSSTSGAAHQNDTYFNGPGKLTVQYQTPVVIDTSAGPINQGAGSCTLQGTLISGGPADIYVYWGTVDAGAGQTGWANTNLLSGVTNGLFSLNVSGLSSNITYWYRCYASNSLDTVWSASSVYFGAAPSSGGGSGYKMKISFTNYNRAETLTNFPVLVVLSNGMAGTSFNFGTFLSTNGYDLRFWNDTETTNLNYEIESWSTGGSSYVWVQVTNLANNSYIWAKWADSAQTNQPAYTTNGAVWESNFRAVWHLKESSGNNLDSTTNVNHGIRNSNTYDPAGAAGGAQAFNGSAFVDGGNAASLLIQSNMTLSVWVNPSSLTGERGLVSKWGNSWCWVLNHDGGDVQGRQALYFNGWRTANSAVTVGSWSLVSVVYDKVAQVFNFFVNGQPDGSVAQTSAQGTGANLYIGQRQSGSGRFAGSMDEARVEAVTRSSNWVWACYMNIASNSIFNTLGPVQALSPIANLAPTSVTNTSAQLSATLSAGTTNYDVYVHWGLTDGTNNFGAWAGSSYVGSWTNVTSTNISYQKTGLTAGTTNYYTFRATNATTNVWATPSWMFVTPGGVSTIVNSPATGVLNGTAVLHATLSSAAASCSVYACWNTVDAGTNLAVWTNSAYVGSWANVSSTNITYSAGSLLLDSTYYFTFYLTNASGMVWATPSRSFETYAPPAVSNGSGPTNSTANSCTLNGTLTTKYSANAWICWGVADRGTTTTSTWDNVVSAGAFDRNTNFSIVASGLSSNVTYWYRCCVSNGLGTAWSDPATAFSATPVASGGPVLSIPVTNGLIVWLDAGAVDTNDTANEVRISGSDIYVKQWDDQSGSGHNASNVTDSAQPRYITNALNGKPVLRFVEANSSKLYLGDLSASFPSAGSIFAVGTINSDGRYNLFGNRNNNDERWVANSWNESRPGSFRINRSTSANFTFSDWPQTGSHVFALESSSSAFRLLTNGVEIGSDAAQYHSGSGVSWNIGDSAAGNDQRLNGDIPEMILYNRILSSAEANEVGGYLAWKYGLTTAYPTYVPPVYNSIQNLAPTAVTNTSAIFNATLSCQATNFDVYVHFGPMDGTNNLGAWAGSSYVGSWTNVVSTNISYLLTGLSAGTTNYYTFRATNATTNLWASPSWMFVTPGDPEDRNFTTLLVY